MQCLLNGDEILKRFGHFAAGNRQMASMQEVVHPAGTVKVRLGLCQFVVVMRKFQINATGVDVKCVATDV